MGKAYTLEEQQAYDMASGARFQEAMSEPMKFFKHDTNASKDPKLRRLAREMGREWRDVWWCLVELMHDTDGHVCHVNDFDWLAHELWIQEDDCKTFVETLVDIGLADADLYKEGWLSLPRVQRNAREYASGCASKAGGSAVGNLRKSQGKTG